jgi:uncharacterized membrane protein YwzB
MRKNETAFLTMIFIGFVLELSLVPWGQWVMLIGIGLLANTYFFGFAALLDNVSYQYFIENKMKFKNTKAYQLLPPYSILVMMIGMLFKFKAWPGGNSIIIIGLVLFIAAIYFVMKNLDIPKLNKKAALKRMIITAILASVILILPNFFWFDIVYREHRAFIEATTEVYKDPANEAYRLQLDVERKKMMDVV